jgi:hypothetical protein
VPQARDPAWDEFRAAVPLTGREPLLGRLRLKLRCRPGAGWIGLSGPSGAGVTRVLSEILAEAAAGGSTLALWVAPAEPGAARGEPLRRALAPWWRGAPDDALEAALAPVLALGAHGARAFLAWVGAGPMAAGALLPPASVLATALEALLEGGLVCADDWSELDPVTRDALVTASRGARFTVLAGHVEEEGAPGPVWPLEPLATGQIGLLLRRWLRSTVPARRLAEDLARRSEGWPGRAVELVRSLARAGVLVSDVRGPKLAAWPVPWPEPHRTFEACLQRMKEEDAGAWRVIEAAALLSEPCDPETLSEAAGVKRNVVDAVVAEVVAARGGRAPGCVLGDAALRAYLRARLAPARRAQVAERLVRAHGRRPLESVRGAGEGLARLEAACEGAAAPELSALLPRVLATVPERATFVPAVAELLARAARRLLTLDAQPEPKPVLAVAERLGRAGHLEVAQDLLGAVAVPAGGEAEIEHATLSVCYADAPRASAAAQALEALLAGPLLAGPIPHRAWRALAERESASAPERRRAWRRALATLPTCDLHERQALHAALARSALRDERPHAVAGHLRRAAVLAEALGDLGQAAACWRHVGDVERGLRPGLAAAAFESAARDWQLLGEPERQAEALEAQAGVALGASRFDEALGLLERAQGLARTLEGAPGELVARLHLGLARAHRGRGDLVRESAAAHEAQSHACAGSTRLAAEAATLVAAARAGQPGALDALAASAAQLEAAGLADLAREATVVAVDARLRIGDVAALEGVLASADDPRTRLAKARVLRLDGRPEACLALLEVVGRDPAAPVEVRAEAYARLAELQVEMDASEAARSAALAAEALLELPHRSREEDARVHRLLARAYRGVGEPARWARHRAAARLALHLPPPDGTPWSERSRLVRARLGGDRRLVHTGTR